MIKKLAGETFIYGLAHILPRLLNVAMGMTYITYRFSDQQNVGIYNILYAYTALILMILLFRLDTAFFRFGRKAEQSDAVFSTALLSVTTFSTIVCGLVIIMAQPIADLMQYGDSPQYLRWFAMIIGFDSILALFYARFRLGNRPIMFLTYRIANVLVTIFITLFFLEILPRIYPQGFDIVQKIFTVSREIDYVFIANLLASGIVLLAMIPELIKTKFSFDFSIFRKLIKYSWPLVIVSVAGIISQSFSTPLQERFLSSDIAFNREQAGIYGSVAKVALLLNLFIVAFNYAAEPFFFNNEGKKGSNEAYGYIALLFTIVISLVAIGVVAYLDVIQYFIGEDYRSGLFVIPYLLFAFVFLGLYYNISIWYKLSDKTHIGALIAIVGMLIMVSINLYYLPKIGYRASAYAALACFGVMVVLCYLLGQRYYPIYYPVGKILKYISISALLVFGLTWMRTEGYLVSLWGSIAILVYLAVVWFTDRRLIKEMIKH